MIKASFRISFSLFFFVLINFIWAQSPKELKILSWNQKHLGRDSFDPKLAAPLLEQADLMAFQEVNTSESGKKALWKLKESIQEKSKEKLCAAFSEIPEGESERFAFLWKNSRISFVTNNGEIIKDCENNVFTVRLGVKHAKEIAREPAIGTFQDKVTEKTFTLAVVHLRPSGKRPQDEVPPLLETLEVVKGPLIMLGDFNLDSRHPVFEEAKKKLGLQDLFKNGEKTSLKMKKRELAHAYDNMWFRGFTPLNQRVINLFDAFPEIDPSTIYKQLSDHCPIEGSFATEQN